VDTAPPNDQSLAEAPAVDPRRARGAKRFALFCCLVLVGVGGWWWNETRPIPLHDALNPMYWVRRFRGDDLYDPATLRLFHGNRSLREVALTFDDGPHTPTGDQILDILKQEKVRATFFLVGKNMKLHPEQVKRTLAEGHEVANHTQSHYRLPPLNAAQIRREIQNAEINFKRITGRSMNLMRPPGIQYNDRVLGITKSMGYHLITASVSAKDFEDVTPDYIVQRILRRAENGSIILLHDVRPSTVVALPRILSALKRQGYRFVTVSEMLARLPKPVVVETNANPPARAAVR
jgi:peptidoglycan/xylan/chitin deacetylase (PgdA/CDA1 family)